jgi:hypothetical protein
LAVHEAYGAGAGPAEVPADDPAGRMIDDEDENERSAELARDEREFIREENKRRRERPPTAAPSSADVELIDVEIDLAIRSPLNGSVTGWPAVSLRHRKERQAVADALAGYDPPTWPVYYVAMIRVGANLMDGDNLQAGFKSVRDQVAGFLGLDDGDARIVWTYYQRRTREPHPYKHGKFNSWCRILIGKTTETIDAEVAGAEVLAPDQEARQVTGGSKVTRSRKPASPEIVGGDNVRSIELPKREDTRSTRVVATLRRLTRPSGRGNSIPIGTVYISLSVYFEAKGEPYRTQGVAVRLEEVDAVIAALRDLAAVQ